MLEKKEFWPIEFSDLDFELPESLIATEPAEPADSARLMVVNRHTGSITHDVFSNLGNYLKPRDAIYYNATRVEARRVRLKRADGEAQFECVFLKTAPDAMSPGLAGQQTWQVLMRNVRRLKDGAELLAVADPAYRFRLSRRDEKLFLTTEQQLSAEDFARVGEMPLPPYMHRAATERDASTYQNFFERQMAERDKIQGSAAAPTAALHFTPPLYAKLRALQVSFLPLCLDIGYGTFAPLTEKNFTSGKLHAEHYYIPPDTAEAFTAPSENRKVVLGTTALRALISFARSGATEGETQLFVRGDERLNGVDALITNFHLPRSSLLLLVAAFCGKPLLAQAYREALAQKYRFYSYGDAMLIL